MTCKETMEALRTDKEINKDVDQALSGMSVTMDAGQKAPNFIRNRAKARRKFRFTT